MADDLFRVGGLPSSSAFYFIAQHFESGLVLLPASADMEAAKESLEFFLAAKAKVLCYPHFEKVYEPLRSEPLSLFARLQTQISLSNLKKAEKLFVLTSREAISQMTISSKELLRSMILVEKGNWFERETLAGKLSSIGYRRDDLAEDQGFFSVRGHLVDVFSPYEKFPHRIEFFGDEVVSIRSFDPETQRSLSELDLLQIAPCREVILSDDNWTTAKQKLKDLGDDRGISRDEREKLLFDLEHQRDIVDPRWVLPAFSKEPDSLLSYLPKNLPIISIDSPKAKNEFLEFIDAEDQAYLELKRLAYGPNQLRYPLDDLESVPQNEISSNLAPNFLSYQVLSFESLRNQLLQSKSFVPLGNRIRELIDDGLQIEIIFNSEKRKEVIYEVLGPLVAQVKWRRGPLIDGFSSSTFHKAFITERDVFGIRKKRSSQVSSRSATEFLRQFSDLKNGDYVIHEDHGIGKFRGLQKLSIQEVTSEFLVIEYADADKLYLPIYRVDKVARYVSEGLAQPRLDKLGSQIFLKRKAKIRKDILRIAHDLLNVAASRKLHHVDRPTQIDDQLYQEFSDRFQFEPTPDQESAIAEVERDLKQNYPMDRLVCGDVGFGKTEVALRAAVLEVLQKKQVAVLAPTTILVEQHYRNFKKRFEQTPFKIGRLSRFNTATEQKKVLEDLKSGQLDLVIGTHRLLQSDIQFAKLGMLIVDEEQRFGVKHKERIKKSRASIDILTLSATPIPRTLQMSIFGIRELSLVTTPPENREAVKTLVGTFDEHLIRNACLKELQRGGQILFVHNRVQTIEKLADRIHKLVPECKIVIAHGQMHENQLEEKIMTFIEHRADLLIATSIIENGLDIPNANTLFVDHAELFGLSDLYQLRGRVGRSFRSSYAYFLIHEETVLTDEASKRLQVIQSCTALGSGFNVATHDMEIRGSGNLLGEEQSGIIAEVGLELYSQMLQETLAEIKQTGVNEPAPELNSGYSAYIPETYIPDASIRISNYKRLDRVRTPLELLNLEDELLDRFGLAPREVENLCQLLRLRTLAYALKAETLDCYPGRLGILLRPTTSLSPQKLIPLLGKELSLDPKGRLVFLFKSAMKDPSLAAKSEHFKNHPEMYDFSVCRNFLKMLCEKAEVHLENV